jgi:hypothetical protein
MKIGAIQLYTTGLNAEARNLAGVQLIDSLDAAIERSVAQTGDTRVAVVPEGPYVVPAYRPA